MTVKLFLLCPGDLYLLSSLGPPSKTRRNGFGQRSQALVNGRAVSSSNSNGGLSSILAGLRNSALLHGSSKLKNVLCNAVVKPSAMPSKKETRL